MPPKAIKFDDGSIVAWKELETLRYEEACYAVNVWVDYEPGIFRSGRVLRVQSLECWKVFPQDSERRISQEKKGEIVDKVRQYFGQTMVRVE